MTATLASEDQSLGTSATEETRQWILEHLRQIMTISMQRVTNPKTPAADRIKWSRIAIAAGQACNAVLRDTEIDAVKQQINELKELVKQDEEETDWDEDRTDQTRSGETREEDKKPTADPAIPR